MDVYVETNFKQYGDVRFLYRITPGFITEGNSQRHFQKNVFVDFIDKKIYVRKKNTHVIQRSQPYYHGC